MNDDKYKLKLDGALLTDVGLTPNLEQVMHGLGMLSVPQLYAAMQSSPDAFKELLKDHNISYDELLLLISSELNTSEKQNLTEVAQAQYGMGHLGVVPPATGRNIIRRHDEK